MSPFRIAVQTMFVVFAFGLGVNLAACHLVSPGALIWLLRKIAADISGRRLGQKFIFPNLPTAKKENYKNTSVIEMGNSGFFNFFMSALPFSENVCRLSIQSSNSDTSSVGFSFNLIVNFLSYFL